MMSGQTKSTLTILTNASSTAEQAMLGDFTKTVDDAAIIESRKSRRFCQGGN
jgi:hypothetical protein